MRRTGFFWLVVCAVIAAACSGGKQQQQGLPPMPVTVVTVQPETIAAHYNYVGQAQASKHIIVRSNVSGYIVDRPYREGSDVPAGAVLFRIDPTKYRATYENALGTLADAKARLANAKITLSRDEPLLQEHAVAQQDVDNAKAQVDQDSADVLAAKGAVDNAKKDLDDTEIRANVGGRVGIAWMVLGARVASGTDSLTTLDQVDPIYVTFSPSDQDVLEWRREVAQKRLTLPNGQLQVRVMLSDGTVFPRPGTVNFADISLNSTTGTQTLRATFPNPGHILLPQQFVRVEMLDFKRIGAILVPQRAVQQGITGQYVYVVAKDSAKRDIALIRPVQAANWQGAQWVINEGLKAGDQVIVDGVQKIFFPGAPVMPSPYVASKDSTMAPMNDQAVAAPSVPIVREGRSQ
ncbi:MAG TPA: efflux RND transporter periplasmic adaptor subunit [Gemmatimonadaceae bacterium]|nr:efflux RND transporter periplasmic adaptor subunit [Gemmatimonadaceae bacterium]